MHIAMYVNMTTRAERTFNERMVLTDTTFIPTFMNNSFNINVLICAVRHNYGEISRRKAAKQEQITSQLKMLKSF